MEQKQQKRRIGLKTKLNTLLIACILVVSVGLLMITYRVYCRKVDSFYNEQAKRAAAAVAQFVDYDSVK